MVDDSGDDDGGFWWIMIVEIMAPTKIERCWWYFASGNDDGDECHDGGSIVVMAHTCIRMSSLGCHWCPWILIELNIHWCFGIWYLKKVLFSGLLHRNS